MFRFILQRRQNYKLSRIKSCELTLASSIKQMLGWLFVLCFLHTLAMMYFESLSLSDALWLTMTTVTTVGYGDISAKTGGGQTATVLLMYVAGITVLAKLAGDYMEYRSEIKRKMLSGKWEWNMTEHLVIINAPSRGVEHYFDVLIRQIRLHPRFKDIPIQLLTTAFGDKLPDHIRTFGVAHSNLSPLDAKSFDAVNITEAKHILVLASDENELHSDAVTFDVLHRLCEVNTSAQAIAECVSDHNRNRLLKAGANQVLRPVRAYPEMIVRALTAPGSEAVLENFFDYNNDRPVRVDITLKDLRWGDLAGKLIENNLGTPLAYVDTSNQVVSHPFAEEKVNCNALIVLARAEKIPTQDDITTALA